MSPHLNQRAFFLAKILLLLLTMRSPAQEPTANDEALFLAGLPVRETPLAPLALDQNWVAHATEFDAAWKKLEARQFTKIREWSEQFLAGPMASSDPLFYFFSGPDILYAQAFFPNASTYVLCGLEPVGDIPNVSKLPKGTLAPALANLRKALNSVLSFSFFITKEMKADLNHKELSGTLPVLCVFLARAGNKIESVELVGLDRNGALVTENPATRGVRIAFVGPAGKPQTLYYFSSDLSNDGIKANPGFTKFCESRGVGHSFVKAASYLMHMPYFSNARDFLLTRSRTILEDDSGIPLKSFAPALWTVRLFGSYRGPINIFKEWMQPDLADRFRTSHPAPLGFSFGYRWYPNESSLIVAEAR